MRKQTCGRPGRSLDVLFWLRRQTVCMCVCVWFVYYAHIQLISPSPSSLSSVSSSLHSLILYLPPPLFSPIPRALSLILKATVTAKAGTRERLARIFLPPATVSCIRKQIRARENEQEDWKGARGLLAASHRRGHARSRQIGVIVRPFECNASGSEIRCEVLMVTFERSLSVKATPQDELCLQF